MAVCICDPVAERTETEGYLGLTAIEPRQSVSSRFTKTLLQIPQWKVAEVLPVWTCGLHTHAQARTHRYHTYTVLNSSQNEEEHPGGMGQPLKDGREKLWQS